MRGLNIQKLNSLENILNTSLDMEKVIRWGKYHDAGKARKENTLQHSYTASLLATAILENEKTYSTDFDPYLVLKATLLHDLGEIKEGDTLYDYKNHGGDLREYGFFKQMMETLPKMTRQEMERAYVLQHLGKKGFERETKRLGKKYKAEKMLFDAIERYGYLLFAYGEYKRSGREEIFVHVLRNQIDKLAELSDRLQGFGKIFYTADMHQQFKEFLKGYEGRYTQKL
jgi:5'-deoxynucleotidase YfbR-like HD superfamily hydrolase